MTYGETTAGQTISRLLGEHPDPDPSADGTLNSVKGSTASGRAPGGLTLAFHGIALVTR